MRPKWHFSSSKVAFGAEKEFSVSEVLNTHVEKTFFFLHVTEVKEAQWGTLGGKTSQEVHPRTAAVISVVDWEFILIESMFNLES